MHLIYVLTLVVLQQSKIENVINKIPHNHTHIYRDTYRVYSSLKEGFNHPLRKNLVISFKTLFEGTPETRFSERGC